MRLQNTPFIVLKKHDGKCRNYAIGRSDTKEMLCIGSFNKDFADMYDPGDKVYLRINPDGNAAEFYPEKGQDHTDFVKFNLDESVIVGVCIDSHWLVPNGFEEWATKTFKN